MVIVEDPFPVALVENDYVVQAIAPDTADEPLHDFASGCAVP